MVVTRRIAGRVIAKWQNSICIDVFRKEARSRNVGPEENRQSSVQVWIF